MESGFEFGSIIVIWSVLSRQPNGCLFLDTFIRR